jgi:hypothetical protein
MSDYFIKTHDGYLAVRVALEKKLKLKLFNCSFFNTLKEKDLIKDP